MAERFDTLRAMLRQMDMKFCADADREWFYLPYRHWAIVAHVVEDGIMFQVPYLARYDTLRKPRKAMGRLLAENSRLKVGRYTIAPDGEVQASYFLLWLDNEPSIDEVQRVLRSLCGLAERFPAVLAGEVPSWPTNDEDDETEDDGDADQATARDTPAGKEGNAGQRGQDQDSTADSLTARDLIDRVFDDLLDELGDDGPADEPQAD